MTRPEYYEKVAQGLQTKIWDLEMNQAFNQHKIGELEHDIGKAETVILYPGINEKEGKKTLAAMQQEKSARQQKDQLFEDKIEELQEQLEFIKTNYLSEE